MRKSKYTEEQIVGALQRLESGVAAKELAREMGVNAQTLYRWKKKYGGLDVNEARRLKQLEDENGRLKRMVADLSLDKQMLQAVLSRKW